MTMAPFTEHNPASSAGRVGTGRSSAESRRGTGASVAVIDVNDAIHMAVRLWSSQAVPPIQYVGGFSSVDLFLGAYPSGVERDLSCVIFDAGLPDRRIDSAGIDRIVLAHHRLIVYTQVVTDEIVLSSLERGVLTYLVKSEGRQHLTNAIHASRTNSPYIGPRMQAALENDTPRRRPNFTEREKEVLVAWCRVETKEAVGRELSIAPTTVRTYLQRIRAKYAGAGRPAPTKAALVVRAIQDGIVGVEDL
jgi:DNA-binding NarL/FixJ family response regulator